MLARVDKKYSDIRMEVDMQNRMIQEMKMIPDSQMDTDQPPSQEHASVARSPLGSGEVVDAAPPAMEVVSVDPAPAAVAAVAAVTPDPGEVVEAAGDQEEE